MGAMESTASRIPRRLEGRTAGDESRARPWNEIGAAASGLPSCGRGAGCGTCSPREAEVRRTCPRPRPRRGPGLDPRWQEIHRDAVDPAALGEADGQGARAATHIEDPRGRPSAGREDAGGYEPLSGEVFPGHIARGPDQLVEDPLDLVSMGHGRVHGRCEAGRAPYTCRPRGRGT